MVVVFQIITVLIALVSFAGVVGEKENENLRTSMTALCITSILAFIIGTIFL